jgi:hypothetical protein
MTIVKNQEKQQESVRQKRLSITKRERKIHEDRIVLIESCSHPNLKIEDNKAKGKDVHYSYLWTVATCSDCGLRLHFADTKTEEDVRASISQSGK